MGIEIGQSPDRGAGDPGADVGRHRSAVPPPRQALRRRPRRLRDDRQPGDDPRDPPVAADGRELRPRSSRWRCSSPAASPRSMAEAAKLNADRGAALIDINFGCPVKKVVNGHAGSALMRDEAPGRAHPRGDGQGGDAAGHAQDAHGLGRRQPQRAAARPHRRGLRHPDDHRARPHPLPALCRPRRLGASSARSRRRSRSR